MWLKIQVFLLAITLITLGIQAEPNSSPNNPLIEEEARACAGLYKKCGKGASPCCEDRPCKCDLAMGNCICKKKFIEFFGGGK
uniref:Omega-ctenitoxin-Pn1a n=2 Tax=Phoneutria TaxID=6917 RepID=TX20B_PHONI|nr:RecName: Full=Omega-ctenitoxin-Pn1a; Short=Omega-CNTX-Pn1a; AltName: Full=Neurotoxin Tx3-2; AltName: Full=PNTx3-2; Flags: Precursor [Phoneutria nigriventer]AAC26168.1 Tx3-2 neurotoxin [Phoneutria nigriventer]